MTVKQLSELENFTAVVMPEPERCICGAYVGDLLSWVMGRAKADDAWVTIMSNVNVVAVASLSDVACVILAEGVTLDGDVIGVARERGINVLSTSLPSYEACKALFGAL